MITPSQARLLTEARLEILRWLVEYRFGTSRQIWQELQPQKHYQHTLGDLSRLRELGLLKSFRYQPERGAGSEMCWLLTRDGAEVTGTGFGTNYQKTPDRKQIEFRSLELSVARAARNAGYALIGPQIYNRENPAPEKTTQYHKLVEGIRWRWQSNAQEISSTDNFRSGQLQNELEAGTYRIIPPYRANDYVVYLPDFSAMVVLILAPFDAGEKYWKTRQEQYRKIVQEGFSVLAVFGTEAQAMYWRDYLKKGGLKLTLVERLEKLLVTLAGDNRNKDPNPIG